MSTGVYVAPILVNLYNLSIGISPGKIYHSSTTLRCVSPWKGTCVNSLCFYIALCSKMPKTWSIILNFPAILLHMRRTLSLS